MTDRHALPAPPGAQSEAGCWTRSAALRKPGVDWIQLREKDLAGGLLFELAAAAARSAGTTTRILINDRLDVAWAAKASGVHLGEASLPAREVARAKNRAGHSEFMVGVSCHSMEAVLQAESDGADYVFFGPVFATPSKAAFGPAQGLTRLAEVCGAVRFPCWRLAGSLWKTDSANAWQRAPAASRQLRLFQDAVKI